MYLSNFKGLISYKLEPELITKSIAKKLTLSNGGIIFLVIALIHLVSLVTGSYWISAITKPILIPALAFAFYLDIRKNAQRDSITVGFILAALAFSFLGDVLLMFVNYSSYFFLLGLGAFLFAHVFYIGAFVRLLKENGKAIAPSLLVIAFSGTYLAALLYLLYPHIPVSFRIPIIVYGIVISSMLMISFNMKKVLTQSNYLLLVFGTMLFVLSDSLIAINKFYIEIAQGGFWIMTTYVLAQYFIIRSFLNYLTVSEE